MKWPQLRLETGRQRCFSYAFVNLNKMRMPRADADPNDFRRTVRWKCSDTGDRQKKCAELNRAKLFAKCKIDIFPNVAKETERQVHLRGIDPAHAANFRVKIDKKFLCRFRQIDRNEKPFRFHSRRFVVFRYRAIAALLQPLRNTRARTEFSAGPQFFSVRWPSRRKKRIRKI
ncbi:MAG: hypothetical protein QOI04_1865 [Verrucomicrobiota bacterium]